MRRNARALRRSAFPLALYLATVPAVMAAPAAPGAAPSFSVKLSYTAHAIGLQVSSADVTAHLTPGFYDFRMSEHTSGLVGLLFHGTMQSSTQGRFEGDRAVPLQSYSYSDMRDPPHRTLIRYRDGTPTEIDLSPAGLDGREPVPGSLRKDALDLPSVIADVERLVAETGRCDAGYRLFTGRVASAIAVRTAGDVPLPDPGPLNLHGTALRCDFAFHQVAGFKTNAGAAARARVHHGSAWFAPVAPGLPPLPVRITAETNWVGDAVITLTKVVATSGTS